MNTALDDNKIHEIRQSVTHEEVGYDSAKLVQLDHHLQQLIAQGKLQAAGYMLSKNGAVFAHKSMGKLSSLSDTVDYMPDSIRQTASMTKVFTAIAIMKLIEDGKLYLEQPIMTILEEFNTPIHHKINIFHLLTHTSGITADGGYFREPYPRWGGGDPENWIKAALSGPLQSAVGEVWSYSSNGFRLLGEIVSRVSGLHYEDYVRQTIIEPLGMKDTYFNVPEHLYDRVCLVNEWEEKRLKTSSERTNHPPKAGSGLYSTLEDLWKMGQMFLNKGSLNQSRILSRKTVEAMTSNQLVNVPSNYWEFPTKEMKYGLGISIQSNKHILSPGSYNHEGAGACAMYIDPVEQFVAVYFAPNSLPWVPEAMIGTRNIIWSGIQ